MSSQHYDLVIVGGGTAGETAAKYIRMADSSVDVIIVEPNKEYYTCFLSNEVLSGHRKMDSIRVTYEGLKGHGVKVIHDTVTDIDAAAPDHAILASNTSSLSITEMATALERPGDFCGMHFFNPVHRMPLVEVIRGDRTSDDTM